ncbi:head-tail connector protein [Ramlibacter sp. MAHUQ-53]|uniref:head-tail connector protein n=1 Tax=unclassified Ramlibacter TaxID=2617605 RepID=UPI003628EFB4
MLVDLTTAKLHLRIDGSAEDAILPLWVGAAESAAVQYLNRNVYADADALSAAVAGVADALATATATYDAAIAAAKLLGSQVEQDLAAAAALYELAKAATSARMTRSGIVINDSIRAAILLTLGHLYENREDVVVSNAVAASLPMGSQYLLQPYRVEMGI